MTLMLTKQPKSSFLDRNIDILTVQAIKTGLESMAVTSVRAFEYHQNAVAASRPGSAALDPKEPYKICQVRGSGIERHKGGCTYVKSACRTPIKTKDISFICSVPPSISIVSISFFLILPTAMPSKSNPLTRTWSSTLTVLAVVLAVLSAVFYYLDSHLDWFYIFDPKHLHDLSLRAIKAHGDDTRSVVNFIVSELQEKLPGGQINLDEEWIFNNAGGAMGAMYIIHASMSLDPLLRHRRAVCLWMLKSHDITSQPEQHC
jgi:hypothetical protein